MVLTCLKTCWQTFSFFIWNRIIITAPFSKLIFVDFEKLLSFIWLYFYYPTLHQSQMGKRKRNKGSTKHLFAAIQCGDTHKVRILLKSGVNVGAIAEVNNCYCLILLLLQVNTHLTVGSGKDSRQFIILLDDTQKKPTEFLYSHFLLKTVTR